AHSYFDGGATNEEIALFFEAMRELKEIQPWLYMRDEQFLSFSAPSLGIQDRLLTITGSAGVDQGVGVFESLEDWKIFEEEAARSAEEDEQSLIGILPSVPHQRLYFVGTNFVSPVQLKEIKEHGWALPHGEFFPQGYKFLPDQGILPLNSSDMREASALLMAVSQYTREYKAYMGSEEDPPPSATFELANFPGTLEVKIKTPYKGAVWGRPERSHSSLSEEDKLDRMRERRAEYEQHLISVFLSTYEAQGKPREWLNSAYEFLQELMAWQRMRGRTITYPDFIDPEIRKSWNAQIVEDFMLRYMPQQVVSSELSPEMMPQLLKGFLSMMAVRGEFDSSRSSKAIVQRPIKLASRFVKRLAKKELWGPRKQAILRMQLSDVDIFNNEAVFEHLTQMHKMPDEAGHFQVDRWPLNFKLRFALEQADGVSFLTETVPSSSTYEDLHRLIIEHTSLPQSAAWGFFVRDPFSGAEMSINERPEYFMEHSPIVAGDRPLWLNLPFVGARAWWRASDERGVKCQVELIDIS
ncbi:hypothetical protein KAI87_17605, partial [Myxococcota bacterium]|nr:hypothetical protein [Myxococcota bacterium]